MPEGRSNLLRRLEAFVGEWRTDVSIRSRRVAGGRTMFRWLDGESFLAEHQEAGEVTEDAPEGWATHAPTSADWLTGLDDSASTFTRLYADSRGVYRVYQMTLEDGHWEIWREAPGFHQRFTGDFQDDGRKIVGRWEASEDGSTWEYDFDLRYSKIG